MNLDKYLETLRECKPLEEKEVKLLCEKVSHFINKAKEILSK
jgi:hypothetical protein